LGPNQARARYGVGTSGLVTHYTWRTEIELAVDRDQLAPGRNNASYSVGYRDDGAWELVSR